MTEQEQVVPELKNAEYAFVVVKQKDGRFAVANMTTEAERQPSLEDVYTALIALQKDLDRQALAMVVVNAMNQANLNNSATSAQIQPEKKFVKRS